VTHSASEPSLATCVVTGDCSGASTHSSHNQELEVCRMDRNPQIVIVDYEQEEII